MSREQPSRRGFLGAIAAALALPATARHAEDPTAAADSTTRTVTLTITTGGSGYTSKPIVSFSDGGGSGGVCRLMITTG